MNTELLVDQNPKSVVSESIKNIRTNLQFSGANGKLKHILVCSSTSGEGKSFVSANLATAFANLGNKVVIIDCDMRLGRQHEIFNISNKDGLSNLLIDDVEKNFKRYIHKTGIKGLYVMPRGIVPPNPSELLASENNKKLMECLSSVFDVIIWDCVPVIGLPDSLIMADLVDKIVIVSAYKKTKIEMLQNSTKSLENFKSKIAGVIVNRMPFKGSNYYTHYYL